LRYPPFFGSDYDEQRAYAACGKIAISWGPIELAVEGLVVLMRNCQDPNMKWEFPVSYSRKVRELKERLKADPRFLGFRDAIRPLLVEAGGLHEFRAIIVHSICQGQGIDGTLTFGMSDQRRGVAYTAKHYSIDEIEAKAQAMRTLREKLDEVYTSLRASPLRKIS
jgi:hypothetical protein